MFAPSLLARNRRALRCVVDSLKKNNKNESVTYTDKTYRFCVKNEREP
jgi:hypothetical protein